MIRLFVLLSAVSSCIAAPVPKIRTSDYATPAGYGAWSEILPFYAGKANTLDATGSTGAAPLTYAWQQLAGPSTLRWSSRTASAPVVTGVVSTIDAAADYLISLCVTENGGAVACTSVHIGAVATGTNNVLVHGDALVDVIFGPMVRWGNSAWSYADQSYLAEARMFGPRLTDAGSYPDWAGDWLNTLGTCTTNGTTTLTCTGGVQTAFCGAGNTTPLIANSQVVLDQLDQTAGAVVTACPTSGTITTDAAPAIANGTYNYGRQGLSVLWGYGSTGASAGANYYDSVLAHYALYYRTGLHEFRDYARTLARYWIYNPNWRNNANPRAAADTGVAWAAHEQGFADGHAYWTRLHSHGFFSWNALQDSGTPFLWYIGKTTSLVDIREDGYNLASVSVCGILDPNAAYKANCRSAVDNALSVRWGPQQRVNGNWDQREYGFATWEGNITGTVTVTNGQTGIVGSGTNFSAGMINGSGETRLWITTSPSDPDAGGDSAAYPLTNAATNFVDSTHLTLNSTYQGSSGGGRGIQMNNLVGRGTQPFKMGIVGRALRFAAYWSSAAETLLLGADSYVRSRGFHSTTNWLYFGRGFPNCEPTPNDDSQCYTGAAGAFLIAEVTPLLSYAYLANGQVGATKTAVDKAIATMYGKNGGPEVVQRNFAGDDCLGAPVDQNDYSCDVIATVQGTGTPKNYGFQRGFGNTSTWDGARMGGPAAVDNRNYLIGFTLPTAIYANAAKLRVTLTAPNGVAASTTCTSSPCTVTVDRRMASSGYYLQQIEYLTSGDAVVARGEQQIAAVQ